MAQDGGELELGSHYIVLRRGPIRMISASGLGGCCALMSVWTVQSVGWVLAVHFAGWDCAVESMERFCVVESAAWVEAEITVGLVVAVERLRLVWAVVTMSGVWAECSGEGLGSGNCRLCVGRVHWTWGETAVRVWCAGLGH